MTKTNDATRKRPTHFEQVPLDIVKKIALEDAPRNDNKVTDEAGAEPTPAKTTDQSIPRRTKHRNGR